MGRNKRIFYGLVTLGLLLLAPLAGSQPEPPNTEGSTSVQSMADEMVRRGEKMVRHGSEGHTEEIVDYGKEMVAQTQEVLGKVQKERGPKHPAIAHIRKALQSTRLAIKRGEDGNLSLALQAAREAVHHARLGRDALSPP